MVKIRLTKTGRKNAPSYRIVVADSRSPRDGKFIEVIGFYNPSHNPAQVKVDKEKYAEWVKKGAQPTEAVQQIVDGKYKFIPYDPKAIAEAKEKAKADAEAKESENSTQDKDSASQSDEKAQTDIEKTEEDKEKPKEEVKEEPKKEAEVNKEKTAEQTDKKE